MRMIVHLLMVNVTKVMALAGVQLVAGDSACIGFATLGKRCAGFIDEVASMLARARAEFVEPCCVHREPPRFSWMRSDLREPISAIAVFANCHQVQITS